MSIKQYSFPIYIVHCPKTDTRSESWLAWTTLLLPTFIGPDGQETLYPRSHPIRSVVDVTEDAAVTRLQDNIRHRLRELEKRGCTFKQDTMIVTMRG